MQPKAASLSPVKVTLESGKDYWWCACGHAAEQPFCDGSHKGSGLASLKFSPPKDGDFWLCQCKATKNPPYCDGSHKSLVS